VRASPQGKQPEGKLSLVTDFQCLVQGFGVGCRTSPGLTVMLGVTFLGGPGGTGGDVVCMFDPFFSSFFGGGGSQLHSNIMSRQLADS